MTNQNRDILRDGDDFSWRVHAWTLLGVLAFLGLAWALLKAAGILDAGGGQG